MVQYSMYFCDTLVVWCDLQGSRMAVDVVHAEGSSSTALREGQLV